MVPCIPESAPFNARQRHWLNGYLAGLLATSAQPSAVPAAPTPTRPSLPLLILFGSQTGTAEALALRIAKEAKARGCEPRVVDAAAHGSVDWKKETNLLVVTSTYGDGDMPDNAQAFWEWLNTDTAGAVAHLNYSVLALGDTNYEHFCAAGIKIDSRLEQLGATRIHPRADCGVDYEAPARAWMETALSALTATQDSKSVELLDSRSTAAMISSSPPPESKPFSRAHPFPANLLANRRLNGPGSGKETRHFEISLADSGLTYEPGDALGVCPTNCPELVEALLRALGFDGEEAVPTPKHGELPLRKALGACYDITRPPLELLERTAGHHPLLGNLLGPNRKDDLKAWLWGRGIIDLLLEAPEARLAASEFAALLKPLAPRLYSIASSPKVHPGQVHLTVGILRYEAQGRARKGVASTFLADRSSTQSDVPIFVQSSPGFKLPADGNTPIIMVGPGTGVAPFRAFLHERRATGAAGRNWLFFGEQRAASDFYYREEFQTMLSDGHLTRLDTAFSRDQAEKIYVQHRMLERPAELWSWLQEGAHFYVCGDASRMAKDVDAALHQIAETAGGLGTEAAAEFVKKLKAEKRYQRDVY
jgi:sulfite reductase (NADPH) flavoprotein alpha-component